MFLSGGLSLALLVSSLSSCLASPFPTGVSPAVQAEYSLIESSIFGGKSHHYLTGRDLDKNGALICGDNLVCADGSCCGPDNVCGYGPKLCGTGCKHDCNAVAMCGKYSEDGKTKCGMNLCCGGAGWCGTGEAHCKGAVGNECQVGMGSCSIKSPPSCDAGGKSSRSRTIGYYQSYNVRNRACMKVSPKDLNTKDYTHLYFAFASINPATFQIAPADSGDVAMYDEFTALKSSKLQTWIAVGGFDFSEPGPTHTTWSDLVASQANRAAFISSLSAFMLKHKFDGVDLDWEYPGDPKRGGKKEDTANFVLLLQEMRGAFGTRFGISMAIAPDYWYLRWFDAKAMEPFVDWFGFMSYDLHGPWDSDVMTLGSIVRGQADIREIRNNTLPLWFAGLDPKKLNFGLANYGRGYTLADPKCNKVGCKFIGASKKSRCTAYDGVMSLTEINQFLVKDKGLKPTLNKESMMMELTWDDQWIGYDDTESFELKKSFADSQCFGGTMFWSIDFNSGDGNGLEEEVTTDGQCGPKNGQKACGNGFGSCCSSGGWCGDSAGHCGSGCQSGKCLTEFETVDGTCGALFGNSYCGNWTQGACCSAAGYCGSTTGHCSVSGGCQSGCDGNGFPIKQPVIGDAKWQTVDCTNKAITSAATGYKERWEAVDSSNALKAAFADWTGNKNNGGLNLPMQVSDFFHGPESMRCDTVNVKNGCGDFLQCDDTNHPAGYLILNSFVAISNIYNNFYFAITKAHALVGATIGSVQSTFANVKDEEKALRIFLDVVGIGFGLFAASSFAPFKQGLYFKNNPVEFDTLKDGLNTLVQGGITIIKDTQIKDRTLKVQNTLEQNVAAMAVLWYDSSAAVLTKLFDGSDDSLKSLTNLMDGGKLQENGFTPPSSEELSTSVIRTMYTFLIPMSWSLGSAAHHPFILDTGVDCATAAKWGDRQRKANFMDKKIATKTGFCLKDRQYFLVSAKGKPECDDQDVQCYNTLFSMLPGTDTLDGTKWGKVSVGDIIEGSFNSWVFNGNKNGLQQADERLVSSDSLTSMIDLDIKSPGIFVIPICSAEEAAFNWYSISSGTPDTTKNYPCN